MFMGKGLTRDSQQGESGERSIWEPREEDVSGKPITSSLVELKEQES